VAPEAWVRQSITDRIVAAIHRSEQIGEREAALLINGGAAFWSEEHLLIGHGFHVRSLIEESEFDAIEVRREIREGGGVARCKFGAIPLRASSGKMAVCVSIWTGFTGDHVFWFYRHEQQFKDEAAANGWLCWITGAIFMTWRGSRTRG